MFKPLVTQFDWSPEQNPLVGGSRFVFQSTPGGRGGNPGEGQAATDDDGAAAADQQRQRQQAEEQEQQQDNANEAAKQQRHREDVRRLQQLSSRNAITNATAAEAEEALQSNDSYHVRAARMLAAERMNEGDFGTCLQALRNGNNSEKALARGFISGRFNGPTYQNALVDLDGGNRYESALGRRLALRQINEEEYVRAREGLEDPDVDIQRASQALALNGDAARFRQEMNMQARQREANEARVEDQVSPVDAVRERTHDQIVELLLQANVTIEELPERERTRPLLRLRGNLQNLNTRDNQNRTALSGLLKQVNEEGEILTKEQVADIWDFTPDTKEQLQQFKNRVDAMDLTSAQRKNIMRLKKEEWDIEEKFLNEARVFGDIMKAVASQLNKQRREKQMVEEASKASGINLEVGTKIQYVHPDPVTSNVQTVTIQKIEPVLAPVLDREGNMIGDQTTSLRIHLDDGDTYSLGRFLKWVDAADVHEVIQTPSELDQALGLPPLGMTLQSGQTLEHDNGYYVDKNGAVRANREDVRVVSVSENGVELDKPVITMRPEQAPHLGLTAPRMSREMQLGEFAKWARRNDAMPKMNTLQDLRQHLSNMANHRNQTAGRNPEAFPPITVEPNEVLKMGQDGNHPVIKKATDDEITFSDGTKMTLPEFLVWAKNNNVESGEPEAEAERAGDAADNIGDEEREKAKEKARKKAQGKKDGNGNGDDKKEAKKDKPTFQDLVDKVAPYVPKKENPVGYLQEVWSQTTFLSMMDLYNMGKEIVEFIKRKHNRKSKSRFSKVGNNLPLGLGSEMDRINQQAENEEVNQYKEAMDQWGVWQIMEKLHSTHDRDQAKACFFVLTEKGELRWDDMRMWNTLNRMTSNYTNDGAKLFIKLTSEPQINPETGEKVSGEDLTKAAIDSLWGEGTWADWFSKNINAYNSNKSAYEHKGKQLEADPKGSGGLQGELQRLLNAWKRGEYVNPHEYEELIDFAIKYGKLSMEGKLFYLLEGVTAKCPSGAASGMTLLHIDRLGAIDGEYLNQFPMLDFFTSPYEKKLHPRYMSGEIELKDTKKNYAVEDYEAIRDAFYKEESKDGKPSKAFSKYMWENMMMDLRFRERLSKGLRSAQNMDHDDAHIFIAPATMDDVETMTGSHNGQQKYFTTEGYKNGYVGFNQFLVSLSNRHENLMTRSKAGDTTADREQIQENEKQILGAVQSYFLYDSYLSGRRDGSNNRRAKLDARTLDSFAINERNMKVKGHKAQLTNLVKEICDAYDIQGIDRDLLFDYKPPWGDKKENTRMEKHMEEFLKEILPRVIEEKGAGIMTEIVRRRRELGIKNPKDPNALGGMTDSNYLIPKKEDE